MLDRVHSYGLTGGVGVAVSGGADSVFLVRALHSLGVVSVVLHVNHQLRGAESDGDEAFVRDLAAELGLPVEVRSGSLPEGNTEQEARRVRYEFFAEQIAAGHCTHVATGHTLDDQAETVLHRFLRGAGTAGLSGIRPILDTGIIRPLLSLRRGEIRQWLQERGILWREDSSNLGLDFQRNRIRQVHLPELTVVNPALAETLASTAEWAQGEEDYWSGELDRLIPEFLTFGPEKVLFAIRPFLPLAVAVQRRLLRRGIEYVRGSLRSIDFRHVEAIRALMAAQDGSGRVQIPGLDIYRSFDWLRIAPPGFDARIERNFEIPVAVPGQTRVIAPAITIEAELRSCSGVYTDGVEGSLDWDRLQDRCSGSLFLRNWRPGDRYHSQVSSGVEKIKTLFQEFRVPLWERRSWPVIAVGQTEGAPIVWARGFGAAEEFAAGAGNRRILVIREVGESNQAVPASHVLQAIELKRAFQRRKRLPGAEVL